MAFIKASHLQANIESISLLPESAAVEVKRRAAGPIAQGLALSRSHWAPLELDLEIANTIYDVVGPRGLRDLNAEALRRSADGPLLRPIRDAARRILGARPDAILRFVHQGWGAIFKDVGEATWFPDDDDVLDGRGGFPAHGDKTARPVFSSRLNGGTIVASNQPQVALDARAWPEGCAGAIDGVFAVVGASGSVVPVLDRTARTLTITCRW